MLSRVSTAFSTEKRSPIVHVVKPRIGYEGVHTEQQHFDRVLFVSNEQREERERGQWVQKGKLLDTTGVGPLCSDQRQRNQHHEDGLFVDVVAKNERAHGTIDHGVRESILDGFDPEENQGGGHGAERA